MKLQAVRQHKNIDFNSSDTLVIFGEVFTGGYVQGLITAAQKKGMHIIYSTVGRRDITGTLKKLNEDQLASQPSPLINIPLEAGFDMQPSSDGVSPVDLCKNIKLKQWTTASLNRDLIKDSKKKSIVCFQNRTKQWLQQLTKILPTRGNVLIAHTMAGGVPRTKILLPALNRVLKGVGNRFFSSEEFWKSDLGFLCEQNFNEVTANTYKHLINLSTPLRTQLNTQNRQIFYTAYSYHGTEVLMGNTYRWQSYSPYLQGFAKKELEHISQIFFNQKINTCVFNVPEILTKSSAIFPGLEIPLYNILSSLQHTGGKKAQQILNNCSQKLIDNALDIIKNTTKQYWESAEIKKQSVFSQWPQHNTPLLMEKMLYTSKLLANLHKDSVHNITTILSELILKHCGELILQNIKPCTYPVYWLGHDIIAHNIKSSTLQ